ncbi:glycosyltransferase family 2 protein [Aeromonas veronii]|nr:glycosyltransferase [Aeromonas veronii]
MFHLTESEVMANWSKEQPVLVSVCCITYKQEKYIVQAIESFLMQKTTFPFEIIIGEDCGGDSTLSILYQYQAYYPNLIKVITSEGNVGANANLLRVLGVAKGDYIAICEGDDYWVDKFKIQKQYECLINRPEFHLCFTAANSLAPNGVLKKYCFHSEAKKIFNINTIIRGGGGFMPTASLMVRAERVKIIPDWFKSAPIGDFYLQVWCSLSSGAIYLPDETCVYRLNSVGSWTEQKNRLNDHEIIAKSKENEFCLNELARYGHRKDFYYAIAKILHASASLLASNKSYRLARIEIERSWFYYKNCDFKQTLMYSLKSILWLYRFLKNALLR